MGQQINFLKVSHRKLSGDEVNKVLNKYSLDDVQKLPKIKIKDNGLSEVEEVSIGDVIEILRSSFAGKSKYYRVVIE